MVGSGIVGVFERRGILIKILEISGVLAEGFELKFRKIGRCLCFRGFGRRNDERRAKMMNEEDK